MRIAGTEINDVKLLKPARHSDHRGFFSETFKESELREQGIDVDFVQNNHSLSTSRWVVRGLHFQIPPFAEAKLLRVTAGSIFDVAVEVSRVSRDRRASPCTRTAKCGSHRLTLACVAERANEGWCGIFS
jgi:dTDP-4-dehydrorhamnose 3,5-epimerase